MRIPRRRAVTRVLGGALAAPFLARQGGAQSRWPNGPIRWVVAFAAGGAADTVARNVALRVSEIVGQQVLVDNRTGGNSLVAATAVMQAPRDGQTFLIDAANQVTNEFLIKDLPFDYRKTWIPVTRLSDFPQVVAVKADFPARTIQDYIEAAKAKGCKRGMMLPVSAPFHCPLMQPAADAMKEALEKVSLGTPSVPLVSNVLASEITNPADIKVRLVEQVTGLVRWREGVQYMKANGVDALVECGTGKVLSGLVKRIDRDMSGLALNTPADIEAFLKTV